jgi:hypothetical protein
MKNEVGILSQKKHFKILSLLFIVSKQRKNEVKYALISQISCILFVAFFHKED